MNMAGPPAGTCNQHLLSTENWVPAPQEAEYGHSCGAQSALRLQFAQQSILLGEHE